MSEKKRCGAQKRDGSPCQAWGLKKNGRCRLHGGLSTGPSKGSQNALKHGIYSKFFSNDEQALLDASAIDGIDDEIKLARIMLQRTLIAKEKNEGKPELVELTINDVPVKRKKGDPPVDQDTDKKTTSFSERKYKAIEYDQKINQFLGRIGQLMQTKSNMEIASLEAEKRRIEMGVGDKGISTEPEYIILNPDEEGPANPIL